MSAAPTPDALELAHALSPVRRVPAAQGPLPGSPAVGPASPPVVSVHGDWDEATWNRAYNAVFGFVDERHPGGAIPPARDPGGG